MYWLPNYVSIARGDMDSNVIITPNPITTTPNNNSANENENVSKK
jgi:hypothetical protein